VSPARVATIERSTGAGEFPSAVTVFRNENYLASAADFVRLK
jgi:hypothetical protein